MTVYHANVKQIAIIMSPSSSLRFASLPAYYLAGELYCVSNISGQKYQGFAGKQETNLCIPPFPSPLPIRIIISLIAPSDDEGACDVFLKVFKGPPGPTPASLLQKIKDTKVQLNNYNKWNQKHVGGCTIFSASMWRPPSHDLRKAAVSVTSVEGDSLFSHMG